MNNNFFKNHGSQIETVSAIKHTPITPLFKGAQLMNYAVWVLILLCCAATKCPVRQCFDAFFTLRCKIETSLGVFLQLFYTNGGKEIRIVCFSLELDSVGNVSWNQCLFFYLQRINNEQSSIVCKIYQLAWRHMWQSTS